MSDIKPELSNRNRYWIPKHRYYELKHFCLQYPEWKRQYSLAKFKMEVGGDMKLSEGRKFPGRPTENLGITLGEISRKVSIIEDTAKETDSELWPWIIKSVAYGNSFVRLKTVYNIPCERDMFYDRYRKFFWLLDKSQ